MSTIGDDIGDLRQWAERLAIQAGRLGEQIDLLAAALARREQAGAGGAPPPSRRRMPKPDAEQFLRRAAERGVRAVALRRRPDDCADVRIDAGGWVVLAAGLADLLAVLIRPGAPADPDGLVAWTSWADLALSLGKKRGEAVSKHALEQRLSRLRQHLWAAGENPYLVMTSSRGVRFALRAPRPKPPPAAVERQPKL